MLNCRHNRLNALSLWALPLLTLLLPSARLQALPEGEIINGGSGSISRSGTQMTIHQTSQRLSTNYQSFNIDTGERVEFIQPSQQSVALNRVVGANASQIFGQLQANGQVFLINPNGIVFGESASVEVGVLLATTLSISDDDFFSNNLNFSASSNGSVSNQGLITAAENGYLALVSNHVGNSGQMLAPKGSIELLAADEILISLNDQSIAIESTRETLRGLVENHGLLSSPGGRVVMNSYSLDSLHTTVVNNTGVIEASSLQDVGGEIVISGMGGDIFNSGRLDVGAAENNTDAGQVAISGDRIAQRGIITADGLAAGAGGRVELQAESELFATAESSASANGGVSGDGGEVIYFSDGNALFDNGASIRARGGELAGDGGFVDVSGLKWVSAEGFVDTRAPNGLDGTFLIDPTDITIVAGAVDNNGSFVGDNWTTGGPTSQIGTDNITTQLLTNNVVIDSSTGAGGTGDINVNTAIDLEGGNGRSLSLQAFNDLNINANICEGGGTCNFVDDSVTINMSSGGSTTIADGVVVDSGNNIIFINSTTNATITGLKSRSTNDAAINIISGAGILQSGNLNADFDAVNGGVRLQSTFGIGDTGGAIDGVAAKLDLNLTASGDINVSTSSGDVELIGLTTPALMDSFIDINGGGALTVSGFTVSDTLELHADGDITINDGVVVDARGETITLYSGGDANISGLQTTNSSTSAVIVSVVGSINSSGDTNLDIDAGAGRATLSSGTGINNLEVDVETVSLSNVTSGNVSIEDINNITLVGLNTPSGSSQIESSGNLIIDNGATITANNLELTAGSGILILPDSGLSVTGSLVLSAQDIDDNSGRELDLSALDLTYTATAAAGSTVLNTSVNRLDVSHSSGNITVLESDDLALVDLDTDTHSAQVGDGNLTIHLDSGDLIVNDNITVTDNNANGVRAGLIDFQVNNGGISVGTTGVASIQSVNTVDEGAAGGLGSEPRNQLAIRFLQAGSADTSQDFTFGNGIGSDVNVSAQGGDIAIDALGGASLTAGTSRQVNLNSDVTISASDSGGGSDGSITLDGVDMNGATLLAANNRIILLRGSSVAVTPPVEPPVDIPQPSISSAIDSVVAALQPGVGSDIAETESLPVARQLSLAFDQVFTACGDENGDSDSRKSKGSGCAVQSLVQNFLNSFLIGGELPMLSDGD